VIKESPQDHDAIEEAKHIADYGEWGQQPPNLREIQPKELAHTPYSTQRPRLLEYRQFAFPGETMWEGVQLIYFYDGTGVIIRALNDCDPMFKNGGVKFYTFAKCVHDLVELSATEANQRGVTHWGRCYHVYACKKCDYVEAVDSSD
jgi:hypothetical protein